MNDKVTPRHLDRTAVVYVRQSSPTQVLRNTESQRLQYAMKQRVSSLGWNDVVVIDEDLGRSAASVTGRTGFQRMVAQVCLGKVGAVAAREVSRFARNNHDWHQLIEMCSLVDTLLIDHETVYDPRHPNDRLLLGLKGTMSEYELDLLRQRSLEARRAKAKRGELVIVVPVGFIKTPDQRVEVDPDLRVQNAIRLVFEKFFELGSARQTMMWFVEAGVRLPGRRWAADRWETWWRRPAYRTVANILTNPTYAGAYAYGRTEVRSQICNGVQKKSSVRKPLQRWSVLLQDHHAGYISWEQFERIQRMLEDNVSHFSQARRGAAKQGPALLAGLLRCRRCGRKLMVAYTGNHAAVPRYCCVRGRLDKGDETCISFGGVTVDDAVSREVLRVLQPAAIDAAVLAVTEQNRKNDDLLNALLLEVKAARYAADRARKQYDAVDPDNRLVAEELERRWNDALEKAQEAAARLEQEQGLTERNVPAEPKTLDGLAGELERAWHDAETDIRLKKRILRTLIHEIIVDVDLDASEVELIVHWQGGIHTTLRVTRRRRGHSRMHTSASTVDAIRTLACICTDEVIASVLNRNGLHTGRGNRWTRERVTSARSKRGIPKHSTEKQQTDGWMNLTQAAAYLGTTTTTVRKAVEAGRIPALHPLAHGPWLLRRDDLDVAKESKAIKKSESGPSAPHPAQLPLVIPRT